jgi:hypothetical protein
LVGKPEREYTTPAPQALHELQAAYCLSSLYKCSLALTGRNFSRSNETLEFPLKNRGLGQRIHRHRGIACKFPIVPSRQESVISEISTLFRNWKKSQLMMTKITIFVEQVEFFRAANNFPYVP